jgi:hypothetical protein
MSVAFLQRASGHSASFVSKSSFVSKASETGFPNGRHRRGTPRLEASFPNFR